jgi:threonine/homoserine/homoserine lactone efflux protein
MEHADGSLLAFLGISVLVIATPGPDTAITIRNTLLGGRAGGLATALGVAGGQLLWAFATSMGAVALLVASEPLFLAVKYAGAAYLVWLGLQALRAAARPSTSLELARPPGESAVTPRAAFHQGLLSNLGNPKMAVFFASLLPQFAPAGETSFMKLAALGLMFSAMTLLWLATYGLVIARLGDTLRRPAIRRTLEGLAGSALIGLGLRLAAEDR